MNKDKFGAISSKLVGKFLTSDELVRSSENYAKICNLFEILNYQYFSKVRSYKVPTSEQLGAKKRAKGRKMVLTKLAKEARERKRSLDKFIDICIKLDVPFYIYMEFQFKHLSEEFLKFSNGRKSLSFGFLISTSAKERFEQCATLDDKKYNFLGNLKEEEKKGVDVKLSVYFSAKKYYNRLNIISKEYDITSSIAIEELEFLSKSRVVSSIYVAVSPLAAKTKFLENVRQRALDFMTVSQYDEAVEAHGSLQFEDDRIAKYV